MSDKKKQLDEVILTLVRDGITSSRDRLRVKVTEQARATFTTGDVDNALQRLRKRGLITYLAEQKKWVSTDILPCEYCGGTGVRPALSSSPVTNDLEEKPEEVEEKEEVGEEMEEKEKEEPGFKGSRQIF